LSWADWSYQHPRSGEWAHDVRDPLRESHLTSVLPAWEVCPPQAPGVWRWLEIGFGRGMNSAVAWAQLQEAGLLEQGLRIDALGCDPFLKQIPPAAVPPQDWKLETPWWGQGAGTFTLPQQSGSLRVLEQSAVELLQERRNDADSSRPFDWVFLDLFSPAKHAEDWQAPMFELLSEQVRAGSALTTYCCARWLRDELARWGWKPRVLKRKGLRDTLVAEFAGTAALP